MARATLHASPRVAASTPVQLWLNPSKLPPRLMPPTLGLYPTQPQKLAGRTIEPITCVPSAAGSMPDVTAAAEPLLEPPGVRSRSHGFRVPRGSVDANS